MREICPAKRKLKTVGDNAGYFQNCLTLYGIAILNIRKTLADAFAYVHFSELSDLYPCC